MAAIHIRNVDDAVLDALKARAAKNHRSLQGEVLVILEGAAREDATPGEEGRSRLRLKTVRVGAPSTYSRDDIYRDGER